MNHRKLRIAFSAVCGVLFLLLVMLWVRSYRAFDRVSGRVAGRTSVILVSHTGHLTAVRSDGGYLNWNLPHRDIGPTLPNNLTNADLSRQEFSWDNTDVIWPYRGRLGFGWIYRTLYLNTPNLKYRWDPLGLTARSVGAGATGVMMPHWFVVLVVATIAALPWLRWRFSLRTLLIATTAVALALGAIVAASR